MDTLKLLKALRANSEDDDDDDDGVSKTCRYCSKSFTTASNRSRHEKTQHSRKSDDGDDDDDDDDDNENDNDEAENVEDKEDNGEERCYNTDEDDNKDDDEETNELEWWYWDKLIKQTLSETENEITPQKAEDLLHEPNFPIFLEKLRENLENYMDFARYMKECDPIYTKIEKTAEKYEEEQCLEEGEAFEKAWDDRKFLLKRFLREHTDEIQELIDYESGEESCGNNEDEASGENEIARMEERRRFHPIAR